MSIGRPIVNKTVYNTMLKAARKALKLARNPKEQARAKARIDRIISMGFTKNVRSLGSKAVKSVKDKVTKNNKELTKQLELLRKTKPKAKSKTPTGNKPRVRTRANTNQAPSKAPKQLEMLTPKTGKVIKSVAKSNAKKPTTTKPKVKGKPKKQSYLEKLFSPLSKGQKTSKSGSLAQASVIKRGAAKAAGGAAVGYAAGKGSNKTTTTKPITTTKAKSKKVSPSQTPSQALAMKNKKIAAAKKRLEDKKRLEAKKKSNSTNRKMIDGNRRRTNYDKATMYKKK